ncbi:ribosome silencing factor [Soehngenia saccharolytica]|nr:ribosome silencing factor [Soehngenia saccharolytica]
MNLTNDKLEIIKKAIEDKKGFDIEILDIKKISSIADYFVIASGNSTTQVLSIVDEIEYKMTLNGYETIAGKEGYSSAKWIILDYDDVVVHIFKKEDREYYNLERLWKEYENTLK